LPPLFSAGGEITKFIPSRFLNAIAIIGTASNFVKKWLRNFLRYNRAKKDSGA
jgi:hypothetical protein